VIVNEIIKSAAEQLARDYACEPGDFFAQRNRVSKARLIPGRRELRGEADFFKIATFGGVAVASVSAEMVHFTKALLAKYDVKESAELFSAAQLYLINKELSKWGKTIGANSIFYLPKTPCLYQPKGDFNIRVYNEAEIKAVLYKYKGFNHALLYSNKAQGRRDVSAVCAFEGGKLAGMAGASSDSAEFWQIGIDVKPEYRGRGLAADLVSVLTREVFMRGAIPYYGTWGGNIASQKVALKCGYYPAWSEAVAFNEG